MPYLYGNNFYSQGSKMCKVKTGNLLCKHESI